MAEFAQLRFEEWAPIFAEIQRLELMRPQEIREITSNIKDKEYAIQKMTRTLDDVLNYVDYQSQILETLNKRRADFQLVEKWKDIEQKILHRMNSLFGSYERLFCNDLRYWEARLRFNMNQKWFDGAFNVYQSAINSLGSTYPYLYQKAASFEWVRGPLKNIESARRILDEGLRLNHRNLDLYVWRYELELRHAEFLMSQADKIKNAGTLKETDYEADTEKCLRVAQTVYKSAINFCLTFQHNCAVRLYTRFIEVILKYPRFEGEMMEPILRDLELNCKTEEESYGAIAQLRFKKGHVQDGISELEKGLVLLQTMKMYDIAVRVLNSFVREEKQLIKAPYGKLHDVLLQGAEKDLLSEESYLIWLELFTSYPMHLLSHSGKNGTTNGTETAVKKEDIFNDAERIRIINAAVERYPSNLAFSTELLKSQISAKLPSAVINQTITKMQAHAPQDSVDDVIFTIVLINMECGSKHKLSWGETFINSSPKRTAKYLQYINLNDGITEVRKVYRQMSNQDSYIVLKTMADMEFKCLDHGARNGDKFKALREIMEKACILHGRDDLDIWMDFIAYEKALRNENNASEIYARALNSVNTTLKEQLTHRYNALLRKTS